MDDLYRQINRELSQGRDLVLATIVRQSGSAPRSVGTRFLIRPDGSFSGTIGGGKLEAEVLQAAPQVFSRRQNSLLFFRLQGEEVAETEMLCGGEVDVFLEMISPRNAVHQQLFHVLAERTPKLHRILVATHLDLEGDADSGASKFIFFEPQSGGFFPDPPPAWIGPLWNRLPGLLDSDQPTLSGSGPGGEPHIYWECWTPPATLFLFGAGHVSRPLCHLAKLVGFRVVVVDDREEFPTPDRFPEADELLVRSFDLEGDDFSLVPEAYVAIITRGHLHDHQLLRQALKKPLRYLGMIGSRRKTELIFQALRREGFAEALIETIHAPIGLTINAQTPEEIAVSIVAELIQIRGQGSVPMKNWAV
jgi:xanthine dehydrogenase accessory factor